MDINSLSDDFIPENYGGDFLSGAQLTGSYVTVPVINPYILLTWSQMSEDEDNIAENGGVFHYGNLGQFSTWLESAGFTVVNKVQKTTELNRLLNMANNLS